MAKRTTVSRTLRNVQEAIGSYIMAPYDSAKSLAQNALGKKTGKKVRKAVRKPLRLGRRAAEVSLDQVIETLHEARMVLAQQAAAAGLAPSRAKKTKTARKKKKTAKRSKTSPRSRSSKNVGRKSRAARAGTKAAAAKARKTRPAKRKAGRRA